MTARPRSAPVALDDARRAIRSGDGAAVRVAVLDSGIDTAHPALRALELRDSVALEEVGLHLRVSDDVGGDVFGHGTAVASIIHRLAPRATLGSFRILTADGRARSTHVSEAAFEAMRRGYDILHCSIGCPGESRYLPLYKEWIDEAYVRGVHVVAAASNEDPELREWPSHFPTVISVTMADDGAEGLAFTGGGLVEFRAGGHRVDVAWTGGARKTVTGSSYAAPVATAFLARLLSCFAGLPPLEAKALLQRVAASADGTVDARPD